MKTRIERLIDALAAIEGVPSDKVAEAAKQRVSARTVRYLRSDREMKRPPNEGTISAIELAAKALAGASRPDVAA